MAYTTSVMLGSDKGRRPKLADYVLRWGKRRQQTGQEQLAIFRALAAQMKKD